MKLCKLMILGGMALAGSAQGQPEQWLQYHTGSEGQAYHQLEATTNPPAGVALPKLNGPAYFARWQTPMDASGGRWVCLDRSRKGGPYDRIYIDSTGNGRLDDKTPIQARANPTAEFPPARVVFKGADGPITYHLIFRAYQFANGTSELLASAAGWYEGTVNFDGVKKHLKLMDGNVNGTFNDVAADPYESDRVEIEGEKTAEHFLGKMLEVGGKLYRIEVARDGAYIKVQRAEDVTLGQVHVPENISELSVFGENGHFTREPVHGQVSLPVGHYRLFGWTINRKDDKGAAWTLSGYNFPRTGGMEVGADKTALLKIGEPVQAELKATEGPDRQVTFSLQFAGSQEESIQMLRGGQRPQGPKLTLTDNKGALVYTGTFEYG
ncbi:MAG TPA: hypothetical protein VN765_14280 [Candidatus Acidoferrum sp.]|nr:hypothetical protein [Candidatus Acidoferrum sp.]